MLVATALSLWRRAHFWARWSLAWQAQGKPRFGGQSGLFRDTRKGSERFCFDVDFVAGARTLDMVLIFDVL